MPSLIFSPDGKQIAFCSTRGGNWDIYTMDIDGKNVVQVTNDPMQHIHPSFSPDGNSTGLLLPRRQERAVGTLDG